MPAHLALSNLSTTLFAFGFGNALMLGWLAAAALPVIIHLWNKRKYKEVSWAAMEYLLAAVRKNSRRIQVEQWLLLAVRTMIVALVVVAMSEPFLERMGLNFAAGTRTLKVFVLDGSYSMTYKPADRSRFDRAKALVQQIVEDSSQGDGFTLVMMAAPPVTIVGKPSLAKQEFFDELQNLKLQHAGADVPATLGKVAEILESAKSSGLDRSEVYFLTDLGRNSWSAENLTSDFGRRVDELSQKASLVVLDLGQDAAENLAITQLNVDQPYTVANRPTTLTATIRNFGTQSRLQHVVELFVDGTRVNDQLIDVQPGESSSVTFRHQFDQPGDHLVEVRLGPDSLDVDNHRWLALPVKQQLRVLCIDGKPAGDGVSGAADYVMLALNPNADDPASPWPIRPEVASESAILERDLSQYDAVFVCNVGQFTDSEARVLSTYVKNGGGLILFLGDRVQTERYNRELGENGVKLLPAAIGDLVSEAQYRFDPLDYRHPLVTVFKGSEQAGLLTTPIYKYFKVMPTEKSQAKIALAFGQGDAAIVEKPFGRGRVILLTTDGSLSSVDPASKSPWTAMSAWPSFVPLVQEMLALAAGSQTAARNASVGETLGEAVRSLAGKQSLRLTTPEEKEETLRLSTDAEGSRWSYAETLVSGPYRVEAETRAEDAKDRVYAVNVDTKESNLARIDPSEMLPQFTTTAPSSSFDATGADVVRQSGLHRWLLYCVLILLFFEVFLAWRASTARA